MLAATLPQGRRAAHGHRVRLTARWPRLRASLRFSGELMRGGFPSRDAARGSACGVPPRGAFRPIVRPTVFPLMREWLQILPGRAPPWECTGVSLRLQVWWWKASFRCMPCGGVSGGGVGLCPIARAPPWECTGVSLRLGAIAPGSGEYTAKDVCPCAPPGKGGASGHPRARLCGGAWAPVVSRG